MADPFPTRDPRSLQIIANVLYVLPPAPSGDGGGGGILDPHDGGAQAPGMEVHRHGRVREGRGDAPLQLAPSGDGGEGGIPDPQDGCAQAPGMEVHRPGRVREGRGDAPLQECSYRTASGNLERLSGLAGQGRAAHVAKSLGSHSGVPCRGLHHEEEDGVGGTPRNSSGGQQQGRMGKDFGASCSSVRILRHKEEEVSTLCSRHPIGSIHLGDNRNVRSLVEAAGTVIHDLVFPGVDKITAALHKAKGPISLFRLDTIAVDAQQLESLFKLLVTKQVKEVVLVNRRWPLISTEFPVDGIDNSGIERLRICFYKIPESFTYQLESLTLLDIAHCSVTSDDLKDLVLKCKRLRELHLGYYREDVRLHSATLIILQIWYSEMNIISILHAPLLEKITVSAVPKSKNKLLSVRLNSSPCLRTIIGNVSNQSISIECHDIRRGTCLMPQLKNLYIGVCLSIQKERCYLLNIFKCFTRLEKLILWRMDEVGSREVRDTLVDDWPDELRVCEIVNHLTYLKIEGFKGGQCEIAIVSAFLEHSSSIRDLIIVSDSEELLAKAKQAFQIPSQVNAIYQKSQVAGTNKVHTSRYHPTMA